MHAEVIAIGDELTSGQRLDTNSQWLSQRLGELGLRVLFHSTVGDDLHANVRVFQEAFDRADLICCTGGLGPTADDLTRQALAQATNTDLVLDEASLAHIRALFSRRKRPMPEKNEIQAMFPAGSRVVPNPHGSAPGIDMEIPRAGRSPSRLFALPGVPAEMREMWQQTVAPALASIPGAKRQVIRHRCIKCFGVGESDLEKMLPDLIRRGREPSVGITVSRATITLRVTAAGEDEAACFESMQPTLATIRESLGNLVFGDEDDELQHAVLRQLLRSGETLSVVESGTGGLVSQWLSSVDRANRAYLGGRIVRAASASERSAATSNTATSNASMENDTDSEKERELVQAMARHVREEFAADYGLAIGRFPESDDEHQLPGDVSFALASRKGAIVKSFPFGGHPDILVARAGKQALNVLRLHLLNQ